MTPSDRTERVEAPDIRTVRKAYAYVTREGSERPQLLVFRERPVPVGLEIPKGTVEPNETPREAVVRETREETGLRHLDVVSKLSEDSWPHRSKPKRYRRHFFHLRADSKRDRWRHTVTGTDDDEGDIYECFWTDIGETNLIHEMDDYFALLLASDGVGSP